MKESSFSEEKEAKRLLSLVQLHREWAFGTDREAARR
jgi:hypothetical protein